MHNLLGMVHPVPDPADDHDTFDTPPRETPDMEVSIERRLSPATPGPEIVVHGNVRHGIAIGE